MLGDYCNNLHINIIHSGVRRPTTNGVEEAVNKDVVNSLLAEKLTKKSNYDTRYERKENTLNFKFN